MKTKWITPRTEIETFIPNEYIAACWGVACNCQQANYDEEHKYHNTPDITHSWGNCGTMSNQWLVDKDNNGIPEYMEERNTQGLGTLRCNITSGSIETIKPGVDITWETYASGGRVWHHVGKVEKRTNEYSNASI